MKIIMIIIVINKMVIGQRHRLKAHGKKLMKYLEHVR